MRMCLCPAIWPSLWARVRALLRRSYNTHRNAVSLLTIGGLTINPSTYEVFLHHRRIKLSVTEFRLLCLLAKNPGDVVPHHTIQQALRADHSKSAGLVKKYIQRLRRKLGDNPRAPVWIASVHGVGYRFIGHDPVSPPLASRVQQ